MASEQATIDELLHRLADAGRVSAKKMFGEYCLYLDGKPIALVCDDTLYLKPTAAGRAVLPGVAEGPPYPGAKAHLALPPDQWADKDRLCRAARATLTDLQQPGPRQTRRR